MASDEPVIVKPDWVAPQPEDTAFEFGCNHAQAVSLVYKYDGTACVVVDHAGTRYRFNFEGITEASHEVVVRGKGQDK